MEFNSNLENKLNDFIWNISQDPPFTNGAARFYHLIIGNKYQNLEQKKELKEECERFYLENRSKFEDSFRMGDIAKLDEYFEINKESFKYDLGEK